MRIKKYEAKSMNDAVRMIKRDFGSEAIILHSRTVNKGGFFGLFGKDIIEVMAGIDVNIVEKKQEVEQRNQAFSVSSNFAPSQSSSSRPVFNLKENIKQITQEITPITSSLEQKVTTLTREMDDIKETLNIIVRKVANSPHPMISPKLMIYYKNLEAKGISEDLIVQILQGIENDIDDKDLENKARVNDYIRNKVIQMLGVANQIDLEIPENKRIIALVGPTGVGKTTTIAKMAANFSLIQKKKVALITIDTFRVAAIEQLRNYSNIIGIPMEVVFNMEDFTQALRKHKDMDIILIDTAGRSPNNRSQILELKKFLRNSFVDTYLVLSVTAKSKDIYNTIQRYSAIFDDKVIFTKVDETDSRGVILDVVHKHHKKLSYFTNGQNVPDDFEVASPGKIADLIFGS
ncbi:MAG: flagellar biosynthesis protein FlhF [Candidatus Margulisbacteria bacterium]|nr:flagellar biosynthesis protein FlhF [Candidatus Margulisiibacteriota bacterium]